MNLAYAGIGSRRTPPPMLDLMTEIASELARRGRLLRSGAAPGADEAFESGAIAAGGRMRIYLPWESFGDRPRDDDRYVCANTLPTARRAMEIASSHHPAWDNLKRGARGLMGRNTHQVLGDSLEEPAAFVLCWAPGVKWEGVRICDVSGGTGLAVRLAYARNIPVFHLDVAAHRARLDAFLRRAA